MKQIRFSKLSYVLLLFVLVACQAQATPTSAPTSLPPTLAPAAAPTQTNNMFTSKIYQLPMSMNIGPQWTVAEQYPDLITLEGPAELGFIIVTDTTKIADSQAPYSIIPFPNDFTTWINTNGLFQIVKTQAVVIGGFTGTQFDAKGTAACNDTQATHNPGKRNWIFLQQTGWNCRPDEHWNFIYLDVVQGKQLLIINSGGPATDEEFNLGLSASQKVLDTVVFSNPVAAQAKTTFTPKLDKVSLNVSFGPDWQVDYNLPGKFQIGHNDFGLSFYIVTNAKLTDPVDAHLIPFPEDFLSWIKSDPDFDAIKSTPVTVAGIEGLQIDATPIWKSTSHLKLFLSLSGDVTANLHGQPDGENIVTDPEQWRFILLDDVNGERVLMIIIDGNGHNFDDATQQSQKVLDTVVFSKP